MIQHAAQTRRWIQWHVVWTALMAILLSGCAAPWPFPQPTPNPKLPDAQQIFRPLEIGPNAGDLATLDPALIRFDVDYQVAQLLFPGLVTLDEQQRPVDWAAESHEVSVDGLTYTFHLHKGMQWSDGSPIDANTFAYSINRALDPCTGSYSSTYLWDIKGAQSFSEGRCPTGSIRNPTTLIGAALLVPDPLTLQIKLERPIGYFLAVLSTPASWAVPQALVERYTTLTPGYQGALYPVSTWTEHLTDNGGFGGNLFKLTAWQHPDGSATRAQTPVLGVPTATPTPIPPADTRGELVFARNERFWGQKPLLKEIHYTLFSDIGTVWANYKDGVGDAGFPFAAAAQIDLAKTLKGSTFHQTPTLALTYLDLDRNLPPFDDIRVRQALSLALNRQAIAHDGYQDLAKPTIHLLPEGIPGYNADLYDADRRTGKDALTSDLSAAQRLMNEYAAEKCGGQFTECAPINIYIPRGGFDPLRRRVGANIVAQWQMAFPDWKIDFAVGCQVQYCDPKPYVRIAGWGGDYPDPQNFLSLLWTTNSTNNRYKRSFVSMPQVDQLCAQADGMSDLAARIPLYQQAEQLLVAQGAAIPYAQPLTTYVVRSRVVGWQIAPTLLTPLPVWQTAYLTK